MDEKNKADIEGQENTPTATPTVEEPTEEVPQVMEEEASEPEPSDAETGESKKGASQRIKELNTKFKEKDAEVKSLKEQIAELTAPVGAMGQQIPQFTPQEPVYEGDIDPNEFRAQVLQEAETRAELKLRQYEAVSRHQRESDEAMKKYSELDPESDSFNKELSESVTEAVVNGIKANPYSASAKSIVDKLMKPYKGAVAREVGNATENLAKQVSGAALRPTSVRKGEKPASEKTIAELEQELGIVHS